ncbi:hypothetical protein GCM10007854_16360 [Algimonas porphyrae]|uniref:Thioesterase family protein n=2 Tax=Algimonas porphyrae TaxID=1128113 RepID=A0ABQ5UZK8_9PROT|nr:hypothetical protein GCM10007854_16360 [Algimonas porphyrae]
MSIYLEKFEQARMILFVRLGLETAFQPKAVSTIRSRDVHIKYLAEARPGQPLRIESALIDLEASTARVGHVMYHLDGRIAATLSEHIEHVYLPENRTFRWPSRLRESADKMRDQLPAPARARSIAIDTPVPAFDAATLDQAGVGTLGGGIFRPHETLAAGHIPFSQIFRRVTTTLGWFREGWGEFADPDFIAAGFSAVALEMRLVMHRIITPGTAYELRSGVAQSDGMVRTIMHNFVDQTDGAALAGGYAAGALFDLNTRRLVMPTRTQRDALDAVTIADLAPPA